MGRGAGEGRWDVSCFANCYAFYFLRALFFLIGWKKEVAHKGYSENFRLVTAIHEPSMFPNGLYGTVLCWCSVMFPMLILFLGAENHLVWRVSRAEARAASCSHSLNMTSLLIVNCLLYGRLSASLMPPQTRAFQRMFALHE